MGVGQGLHGGDHPGVELLQAFAAGQCEVRPMFQPPRPQVRVAGLDRGHVQALEHAEALLAQTRNQGRGGLPGRSQGRGGLLGALQVAAEQLIGGLGGQALAQPLGLRVPEVIERDVDLALETLLAVPVGFAMADEDEVGHAVMQK